MTVAGNSALWQDWTKKQVRDHLYARIRRSVADLKKAQVFPGEVEPGDEERYVSLIPEPEDILLIFAGGEGVQHVVGDSQLGTEDRVYRGN